MADYHNELLNSPNAKKLLELAKQELRKRRRVEREALSKKIDRDVRTFQLRRELRLLNASYEEMIISDAEYRRRHKHITDRLDKLEGKSNGV